MIIRIINNIKDSSLRLGDFIYLSSAGECELRIPEGEKDMKYYYVNSNYASQAKNCVINTNKNYKDITIGKQMKDLSWTTPKILMICSKPNKKALRELTPSEKFDIEFFYTKS
jgi:hypothetical protein